MHELSLLKDLLAKIAEVAAVESASSVVAVKVWLGAFSHISADHFREHFEEATVGHVAEGARLEVTESDDEAHPNAQEIVLESVEVAA